MNSQSSPIAAESAPASGTRHWPAASTLPRRTWRPGLLPTLGLGVTLTLIVAAAVPANVLVNQDLPGPGWTQNSPGIVRDPGSGTLLVAYSDGVTTPGSMGIGVSYRTGGTGPWTDAILWNQPFYWNWGVETDASIAADGTGNVYAACSAYDQWPGTSVNGVYVSISQNGGATFPTTLAVDGASGALPFHTKPKLEVDDFPGSPYHQSVYLLWEEDVSTNSDVSFARSGAGGTSWSAPLTVNDSPGMELALWPDIAVGPNGEIAAAWLDAPFWTQSTGTIRADCSLDGGQTFGTDVTAAGIMTVPTTLTDINGAATYGAMSYPSVEHDPSTPGRIGIAYAADPDAGRPGETRLNIGSAPGTGSAMITDWQSSISCRNGFAQVAWSDLRNSPTPDIYYRRCTTATGIWGPEVNLTAGHPVGGTAYPAPTVVTGASNVGVIWGPAWLDPPPADNIHFVGSLNNGQTWGPVMHINPFQPSGYPVATCSGTNICVAWTVYRDPQHTDIYATRSIDGGQSWANFEVLVASRTGGNWFEVSPYLAIASSGNYVYLIWSQRTGILGYTGRDIYFVVSSDAGLSWSSPVRLDTHDITDVSWSYAPRITCDSGGNVYACWYDDAWGLGPTTSDITFARSNNYGASWWGDIRLFPGTSLNGGAFEWPDITCQGSNVWIAYQSDRQTLNRNFDIYACRSTDGGITWSSDTRLDVGDSPEANVSERPRICADGTNVYAVWLDQRGGQGHVYTNRSTDSGVTWQSTDSRLDQGTVPAPVSSTDACVVADNTGPYYLWNDGRNNLPDVYTWQVNANGPDEGDVFYIESNDGGQTWSSPLRVNDDATVNDQTHPWLDIKPNGTVDVVWYDNRNDPNDRDPDVFFAALLPGAATFQPNTLVTTQPVVGAAGVVGDYIGVEVDGSLAHIVWTDTRRDPGFGDIFYQSVENPQPPASGACCTPNRGCFATTGEDCEAQGGFFMGLGVPCDPDPCVELPDYGEAAVGNCGLTVTDQGIIGFMDGTQAEGSGFVYPASGPNQLYLGSLWVSNEPSTAYNRDYDVDPSREWIVSANPDGRIHVEEPGDSDLDLRAAFTNRGARSGADLLVTQESWSYATPGVIDDFVMLHYRIENRGAEPYEGAYVGVFLDLDLETTPYNDEGGTDAAGRAVFLSDPDGVHAGVVVLGGPETPVANLSLIHNPTYVWPNQYISDADKYAFLAGTDPAHQTAVSFEPNDWGLVASAGPFAIAPGGAVEVSFAIVGGLGRHELDQNAAAARQLFVGGASSTPDPEPAGVVPTSLLPNSPNPFFGQTMIQFELSAQEGVALAVFDVNGRRVRLLAEGPLGAGRHAVAWDGRDDAGRRLPAGTYFVRMSAGGRDAGIRITLMR